VSSLLEPFTYGYMLNAMWVSALVGGVCAFLSAYLMLKGWSLIGDALSHAIVPGVAGAYMLGLPFSIGAFFSGGLAAAAMLFLNQRTKLKEDAIIGLIFSSFFGLGLFMVSLSPTSVNIQTIVLGNILAITPEDTLQLAIIGFVSFAVLIVKWKDLMVTFFDETHARSIGLNTTVLKIMFFTLLSASTVAALQTVGAFELRRRLCKLFPGRRDRRNHRRPADTGLPRGLLPRPQARHAGGPPPRGPGAGCRPMTLLDTLLQPFQLEFMRYALIISVLVAIPTALLSCFLVLKGWSLMGDAISHAVFPGVVIAYIVGFPYAVGAFAAGMICALATGFLKENSRIKQDTVMGVVFSGMFGLGLVLYVKIQSDVHLDHILFGDMLGVDLRDIVETGVIATIAAGVILVKWRDLLLHAFDPAQARAIGLPVRLLHYGLLAILSLTIVGALKAVGIILAIAMLIAPGAIAFLLTRKFSVMLAIAVIIAVIASFLGVYLSFFIDSAPAPTIVLLMTIVFIAAFVFVTSRTASLQGREAALAVEPNDPGSGQSRR
jgi:manganese/iron transport system permease protein